MLGAEQGPVQQLILVLLDAKARIFLSHVSSTWIHYGVALKNPGCSLLKTPPCLSEEREFRALQLHIDVKTLETGFRVGRFGEERTLLPLLGFKDINK